jgi:hypothetical protein
MLQEVYACHFGCFTVLSSFEVQLFIRVPLSIAKRKGSYVRMVSSGLLCRVAPVRTDVSEEPSASFIRVTRIGELRTTLAATSNQRMLVFFRSVRRLLVAASVVPSSLTLVTLMKEALSSSETSVLTRATWHNIPEDAILERFLVTPFKSPASCIWH